LVINFVWVAPVLAQPLHNSATLQPSDFLYQALEWIESLGVVGAMAFIVLYIVATIVFLPGSILTLGAGVLFGLIPGTIYVFIGATLGSIAAFLVGRYFARGWVSKKIAGNQNFVAIDQAVSREGFKIVLLTRLSPIFPFTLLNYAFGITGVSFQDYVMGAIGMLPGTLLYVYIGSLAGDLARIGSEQPTLNPQLEWAIRIIGLIVTISVTLYITRIARKSLAETVSQE